MTDCVSIAIGHPDHPLTDLCQSLNLAPCGILIVNPAGEILMANREAQRILGYAPGELEHRSVDALLPERVRSAHAHMRGKFLHDRIPRPMGRGRNVYALHKNGSELCLEVGISALDTSLGPFVVASLIDITERADGDFRFLVDQAPDGMLAVRGDDLLFANRAFISVVGFPADEPVAQWWPERLVVPEDLELLRTTVARATAGHATSEPLEIRLRHYDGRILHFDLRASPVTFAKGPAARLALRDMTELRTLEQNRDLLAAMVESSEDAIIGQSPHGVITTWNRGAAQIFGRKAEEAIGVNITDIFAVDSRPTIDAARFAVENDKNSSSFEAVGLHATGRAIDLSIRISAIRDADGHIRSLSLIARDIAAAKAVERQLVASVQEKEVLLREIHHRVKNNLQVVASLLNLQSRRAAPELAHVFDEMQERVHSIALFHDQLCHSENLAQVGVAEYLRELAARLLHQHDMPSEQIRPEIEAKNILLGVDIAVPFGLIANELISNALKHAFPRARRGSIRISVTHTHPNLLRFVVADDGVGLPKDFSLANTSSLGMILVRRLARQLDGALEIGPGDQGGTKISVTFPFPSGTRE